MQKHGGQVTTAGAGRESSDGRRARDLDIADECRLNLIRLTINLSGGRALSIAAPGLSMAPALATYHENVDEVDWSVEPGAVPPEAERGDYAGATLYGASPDLALLARVRRLLAPRGWLLVGVANAHSRERIANAPALTRRQLCLRMKAAGFDNLRTYWVEPSLAIPRQFVPATPEAVRRFESWRAQEQAVGRLRRCLTQLGAQDLLYPALVVVGIS